ncbi:MAG TPA: 2-amino-4-hydroxy-6-hydroxymethyldihydropteridine diphosphokinase [Bacteroidota bacterium]|nr:2-amino-4-hydroxy-6-hydroxymethyldihydropteridine diphosphokinase [Bacteroidota bacterium]
MKIYRVFLGIGSNIGERDRYLNRAAQEVAKIAGTRLVWCSSVYETDPYGKTDQPKFLNAAAEIETPLAPGELMGELRRIEGALGRTPGERWAPREIDIDILLYDGLVYSDPVVTVPHPDLERRRFALVPLREIAPDLVHPVNGMTVEEMASACAESGRVVKTPYHIRP